MGRKFIKSDFVYQARDFIDKKYYVGTDYSDEKRIFGAYYVINFNINILKSKQNSDIDIGNQIKNLTASLPQNSAEQLFELINNEFIHQQNLFIEKNNEDEYAADLFCELISKYFVEQYFEISRKVIESIDISLNTLSSRIDQIAKAFRLDENEKIILVYEYIHDDFSDFTNFINEMSDTERYNRHKIYSASYISKLTGLKTNDVRMSYHEKSNLMKYNLLANDTNIAGEVSSYLNGFIETPFVSKYYSSIDENVKNPRDFTMEETDIDMITDILANPKKNEGFRILLYGKPGTGKTEFARSISVNSGYKVYKLLEITEDNAKNADFRLRGLCAFESIIDTESSLIIVDEADELLNTRENLFAMYNNNQKGRINIYFDESKTNQIWIVNNTYGIDESTKRRFNYCVYFPEFTIEQKVRVFKTIISEYGLKDIVTDDQLEILSSKYEVNAGNIKNAIHNYLRICNGTPSSELFLKTINSSLNSFMVLRNPLFKKSNTESAITDKYTLDGLNILSYGYNYMGLLESFNESWKTNTNRAKNMNMLLYGPSGTGKTEFAKFIAKKLNRKIIVKSPSDILSKWVGGTEENLSRAFQNAASENAILFIDETDSILRSRDKAEHSWESTQVNELLIQMENFKGIFISSTNRFEDLDAAVMRRFNLKLKFDYIDSKGVDHFSKIYFSEFEGVVTDDFINRVSALKLLAPGDFKVVYQKLLYINPDEITGELILNMLIGESALRKPEGYGKVGFLPN